MPYYRAARGADAGIGGRKTSGGRYRKKAKPEACDQNGCCYNKQVWEKVFGLSCCPSLSSAGSRERRRETPEAGTFFWRIRWNYNTLIGKIAAGSGTSVQARRI
ncbi:hypothetical protein ACYULU_01555 [Breznakiellaceae bacterium SP9]